ncbi:hypothetical protein [Halorubrum sp. CBA1229]|uniref:hypothetical protein n=1 Tax=Halorubrum sp. CBA1229 TaxID=1853699 RepID=UPI0011CE3FC7|nr:hypothetical protein [Halorubrum sp. CBA1229]QKY18025.1 hypothetical protein Hrr1229_014475 [Halorubrum sp. CBA1229]
MTDQGMENLSFLSGANRYNTERRMLLRGYFDSILQSGAIFDEEVTHESIQNYWENEGLSSDQPENVFNQFILMYPDDPDVQHYQLYLNVRYADISDEIRNKIGYSAIDLISMEAFIYNLITERANDLDIGSTFHTFEDKKEFVNSTEYEVPSEAFQNKWLACIEFSRSELISAFLSKTEDQPFAQKFSISDRIDVANSMINFLSVRYDRDEKYSRYQFLSTPLFEVEGKEDRILVPFPSLLVSTTQMRIEELFQQHEEIRTVEDRRKGDIVEELTLEAFAEFDSRNLIQSFKYNDPHPRETDGLLFFEDSFWCIEIKSHPIFRKIPNDLQTAKTRFKEKTKEAIAQGENTLNFLREHDHNLPYNLAGMKSPRDKESGTIVVLDGLLPTLFSQNKRMDRIFDMSELYESVAEEDRVLLITLFDLFELANQTEELDRFEDYLLWRTNYGYDMPVFSFNERDYWAMFFDNYDSDAHLREAIDEAAENDSLITYISSRFNDKPHLPDEGL